MAAKRKDKSNTEISKFLCYILRHGAVKHGLSIGKEGFVKIDSILALPEMNGIDKEDLINIVRSDGKGRYLIKDDLIRANQGHSITGILDNSNLYQFQSALDLPVCIHATYPENLPSIMEQGLSRMNRNHIHFTTEEKIPGKRRNMTRAKATVDIYIDVDLAMKEGHTFFRSDNGVVLTKGPLEKKYFKEIRHTS